MSLIAKADRPKAVMQRGGFIRNGIMYAIPNRQRLGRVSWRRGRQGPQPLAMQGPMKPVAMYALVSKASVKPRYEFEKSVTDVVNKTFEKNFEVAFAKAVRTATR
jgi:hypothetical protein